MAEGRGKKRSAAVAFELQPRLVEHASARADAGSPSGHASSGARESKEYAQLRNVVEDTVRFGHGNSILLMGPRGAGKSMLLKRVLRDVSADLDAGENRKFATVKLNGLVHSDDKLALREIMRQLMLDQHVEDTSFGSFAEAFENLLGIFSRGSTESLPIVITLEEFEVFTQQPRQTLLYNLFDTAQSSKNPIIVVGMATQLDVMELLEKRVKSRFNHRFLHIHASPSLEAFLEKASSLDFGDGEGQITGVVKVTTLQRKECAKVLRTAHENANNVRHLHVALAYSSAELRRLNDRQFATALSRVLRSQFRDSKARVVKTLPPLAVPVTDAILAVRDRSSLVNFAMVYDEYRATKRASGPGGSSGHILQRKNAVRKVFEQLIESELLKPVSEASYRGSKDHEMYRVMFTTSLKI
ncbi:hypothetical protein DFJ74DRAFT_711156 [Hyaloraphidium curvatum]|nr:hypothetical protein DFJ74DRAFT_711156 [Hyaloraphidium curvatum]